MVNPHGTHTKCQHLTFAEAQMWKGVAASMCEDGRHLCSCAAWAGCGCWGSHRVRVRDGARGCFLPTQDRVEDSLEAPKWSSEARPQAPPMLLRDAQPQGGSVGAVLCPFPGNEVLASAVTMLPLIHSFPNFTLVSCGMLRPFAPLH